MQIGGIFPPIYYLHKNIHTLIGSRTYIQTDTHMQTDRHIHRYTHTHKQTHAETHLIWQRDSCLHESKSGHTHFIERIVI